MAKVPKHRRIKRPTVLIKRTRCIKSTKANNKSFSPLYQKLKVNNHSLAKALSQEKQESQILFTRNVELLAEVQDLVHACNCRDLVITNILKNSKDMMATLVTMSGYLTNTISACQEFVSTQSTLNRTSSSSSAGRRESIKRLSTKSPARGVVKPMVSGHTITKPTINLSRVNMQRLQNANLSIIEESSSSPERNLERPSEGRRSRQLPVPSLRNDEDNERVVVNRRTSRFSGGRLSSGRYSKRNSGRLSGGGGVAGRLSKRSSDHSELIKSPRVTLQDVSRYLTNNQTVNIRLLSETETSRRLSRTAVEDTEMSDQSSPSGDSSLNMIIPETQDSAETSESEEESIAVTVRSRKQSSHSNTKTTKSSKKTDSETTRNSSITNSDIIDPLEGSSWMYEDVPMETDDTATMNANTESNPESDENQRLQDKSPVSSLSNNERRRTSAYFRIPEIPKSLGKTNTSKLYMDDDFGSPRADLQNGASDEGNMFSDNNDDEDQRVNYQRFITQRRGPSVRSRASTVNDPDNDYDEENDEEEEDTLMINMRQQIKPYENQKRQQQIEQPERLQFDMDELLNLTPLKPLQSIQRYNGVAQVEVESEPTVTIQLTQRLPKSTDNIDTLHRQSTVKLYRLAAEQSMVRSQEATSNSHERRLSELTTTKFPPRIELPRLTDVLDVTEDNHHQTQLIQTPDTSRIETVVHKRKRIITRPIEYSASEDNEEEEAPKQKTKKAKGRKKKSQQEKDKDKDPSAAKVVLQKLNDMQRNSTQSDNGKTTERKNSDESLISMRSSTLSRADQSSDSESSSTISGKQLPSRPRRQKAPKNLAEPNLTKKLRRN